jgi:hypothetical protein
MIAGRLGVVRDCFCSSFLVQSLRVFVFVVSICGFLANFRSLKRATGVLINFRCFTVGLL